MNRRILLKSALTGLLAGFGAAQAVPKNAKSIIVFYSRSGHTASLAKALSEVTGAEVLRIESEPPYPADYEKTIERFQAERAAGELPLIRPIGKALSSYDVIYIGSPTWGGHLSYPIQRFLLESKLKGKRLCLFTSQGGSGEASTPEDLKRLAPGNTYQNIAFYGSGFGAERQFKKWLSN